MAGVAALVLARNPELRWDQVKEIIARSCERIDPSGGRYDASGHSPYYGFGRVNARKAVRLALPKRPKYSAVHTAAQDVVIPDLGRAQLTLEVGDSTPLRDIRVGVDIEHSYIGDLIVRVVPPGGGETAAIVLHDREGGGTANLRRTFDAASTPALRSLAGQSPQGTWTLQVEDCERLDTGRIRRFTLEVSY